jgi:hypothetical protein
VDIRDGHGVAGNQTEYTISSRISRLSISIIAFIVRAGDVPALWYGVKPETALTIMTVIIHS